MELNEHQEACVLTEWLQYQKNLGKVLQFGHIPNETPAVSMVGRYTSGARKGKPIWATNRRRVLRMQQEGVCQGIPDYVVVTRKQVVFVELKSAKGTPTEKQKQWIESLNSANCPAAVCYGAEEATQFISRFF